MFLSLIPRLERDPYKTHVYIYSYFPDLDKNAERPFIFRETSDYLIVLSRIAPNCNHVNINQRIVAGSTLAFSLICSPQRGISRKINGRRITKRTMYESPSEISLWLDRRLGDAAISTYRSVHPMPDLKINTSGKSYEMPRSLIKGVLQVKDRATFIELATNGVGPKGWLGCGMLLMPEIMKDAMELAHEAA